MTKPCRKCGGIEKDRNRRCIPCTKKRKQQYYAENKEQCKENYRRWAAQNREKVNEYNRRYYAKNSEEEKQRAKKRYENNLEKRKAQQRRWKRDNPGKVRRQLHRRMANKANVISEPYSFQAICNHYDNKCLACGRTDRSLTPDHIIPLSRGGDNVASNIQPLCGPCNSSKGAHHTTDYRPDKGPPMTCQLKFWR